MWQRIPMTLGVELPMPRESHCSICIGSHLIVIGGITSEKIIVPDCWVFYTSHHTWKKVSFVCSLMIDSSYILLGLNNIFYCA